MISQLTGTVVRIEGNSVILDVNGVGYQVFVPVAVLASAHQPDAKLTLATHLVVREDELSLYGFLDVNELRAFKLMLGVTGVGPKVALALLSTLTVSDLSRALASSDTRVIVKVPGVGPKLAQRLCLELGDKMAAFVFEQAAERAEAGEKAAEENSAHEDVIEALVGMGFGRADARRAADRVFSSAPDRAAAPAMISAALKLLTGGRNA